MNRDLTPLPQHLALTDWLIHQEPEVWQWFSQKEDESENAEAVRLSLLRDTYRLDAEGHPDVFREAEAARAALGLETTLALYQGQGGLLPNAAVCHLPGEAHLVFSGPILSLLTHDELRAVIGHELAHHMLWQSEGGAYLLADRILDAASAHPAAAPSHERSARLWRLATELFADRGAYVACGSLEPAVSGLVKSVTGLAQVSASSYLAQADEIFAKSNPKTAGLTHPEAFIRARALKLWVEQDESLDAEIARMLDGDDGLDDLTLVQQDVLTELTRRLWCHLLRPDWARSDEGLALAKSYFPDFRADDSADDSLTADWEKLPTPWREYGCQVMLDFCAADPEALEQSAGRALAFARDTGCLGVMEKLLAKDLKMKVRDLKRLKETEVKP